MPPVYESRLSHFKFEHDNGTFIITTKRDEDFERTAKVGPVISTIAQEYQGNPNEQKEAIHRELYMHVWKDWLQYKDGDAPATGQLFERGGGNGNNGNGPP